MRRVRREATRALRPGRALPLARRPRPRRRDQEAVTWGGADWLRAAGTGAASKLRRGAASARRSVLGAALRGDPAPCCRALSRASRGWGPSGCPPRGRGRKDAEGALRDPRALRSGCPSPAAQPVVLPRAPVPARRVEPASVPRSPAGPKALRLRRFAVGECGGRCGALGGSGRTPPESPAALWLHSETLRRVSVFVSLGEAGRRFGQPCPWAGPRPRGHGVHGVAQAPALLPGQRLLHRGAHVQRRLQGEGGRGEHHQAPG